jgi:hypothetical protein
VDDPQAPSLAIAMAIAASVTVSIAALRMGIFSVIFRVTLVETSTSWGRISEYFGTSKTSSKVSASFTVIPPGLALVYYTANNLKCNIIEFMREIVTVLLLAALPISELRGAIPVAMGVYGFDPISSYLLELWGISCRCRFC